MEYSARELTHDREPHAYGIELEALTDACGLVWGDLHDLSSDHYTSDTPPRKQGKASDHIGPSR